jgi:tRNA (cmo5U34)-methyltransferase
MQRDQLYATFNPQLAAFRFDEQVVEVFDDMIERSVPGYRTILAMLTPLAARYATAQSHIYDLGCSLGASSAALLQGIKTPSCKLIAADNSTAMIERCGERLSSLDTDAAVEIVCADIQDLPIEKASMVVLNFTLQFIKPSARTELLSSIVRGMKPGGVLVLSEKIAFEDAYMQKRMQELHEDFKRLNGYSEMEISQKRTALEDVLIPETLETHQRRLHEAGFKQVETWFQSLNFCSMLAFS